VNKSEQGKKTGAPGTITPDAPNIINIYSLIIT